MRCKCRALEVGDASDGCTLKQPNPAAGREEAYFVHSRSICDWAPISPKLARQNGMYIKFFDAQAKDQGWGDDDLIPEKYPPPDSEMQRLFTDAVEEMDMLNRRYYPRMPGWTYQPRSRLWPVLRAVRAVLRVWHRARGWIAYRLDPGEAF